MATAAVGAEKPTVTDTQPEINPAAGWKVSRKKLYSPPLLGYADPNSA